MTGERSIFQDFKQKKEGKAIFEEKQYNQVIGGGQVSLKPSMYINNVLLADGLKPNLLSISQLCDSGNNVIFNKH